jgi:hypothetical protein
MASTFLRNVLEIPDSEVTFQARGFHSDREHQRFRLEGIGRTFVAGFHYALDCSGQELLERLAQVELEDRGFAFEGAAMALAIRDAINPFHRRFRAWIAGPGHAHEYMTLVGAGWAIARIPWHRVRAERHARSLHPFLWPLVLDGFGFHQGYFHASNLNAIAEPNGLETDLGRFAYDQGLGRSLWFVCGANPGKIAALIEKYHESRRWALWSGAGLAFAYAGGTLAEEVQLFARVARPFTTAAAQGACFAAKARMRAGNPAAHTDMACRVLCGLSDIEGARLTDQTYTMTVAAGGNYRDWCKSLQSRLENAGVLKQSGINLCQLRSGGSGNMRRLCSH